MKTNSIELNLKNISVGQVVKNYKVMCSLLGDEVKNGSRSKGFQFKKWKRYFDWENEGHKFIITKIYDEPLPKEDGRINNGGNNTKYEDLMDRLIINLLVDYERIDASYSSLMNDYFDFFTNEYKKLYSVGYKRYAEINNLGDGFVGEYQQKMGAVIRTCLMTSLNRLKNNNIIDFELNTIILDRNFEQDFADDKMLEKIKEYEDKVHDELGTTHFKTIQNPRIYKQFNEKVCEYLDITNYWKVYSFELIDKNTEKVEEDSDELVKRFIKSTIENVKNKENDYGWGKFKPFSYPKYEPQIDKLTRLIWKLPEGYTSEYEFKQLLIGKVVDISNRYKEYEENVELVNVVDLTNLDYGIPF